MNEKEVVEILTRLGCNKSLKGFDMFVKLILVLLDDFERNPHKTKYKLSDYYYQVANEFDTTINCVISNIRTAVTISNTYGNGMYPKDVVDMILKKIKRGNH